MTLCWQMHPIHCVHTPIYEPDIMFSLKTSRWWWKLLQKWTIINAMDKRKHVKGHFSSVGRGGEFISWGKSYVFQRRPSLSPNAQRTNCQTEQAKVELIFISVQLLRSKCFQRCLNVKKTYIGVSLLSSLWFT